MSSASVLRIFDPTMPGPVMPVDVAVQLYIAHSPPLRSFLSSYEDCRARNRANTCFKPLRPCLSTKAPPEPPCLGWQSSKSKAKKKVVFADSKGMSLTAVRVFSPSNARKSNVLSRLQFSPELDELESATSALRVHTVQSRALDFPQPAGDYLDFRSRLTKNSVCLENCTLQGRVLTGTVKVRNLAFEKAVHVRVTFDSWKSHRDFECTYMNNVYGCQNTDTFAFTAELPAYVPPQNNVQFCISYTTGGQTYWDNNDGRNYGLVVAAASTWKQDDEWNSPEPPKKTQAPVKQRKKGEVQFGRLSSSNSWKGLFPEWQSWGCIETGPPYW